MQQNHIAYHAGNDKYSQYSIGIEHAGYADVNQYTKEEYIASAKLVRWLCKEYDIPLVHYSGSIAPADPKAGTGIIGHYQVPSPSNPNKGGGQRSHYDPGKVWDWNFYMGLLTVESSDLPNNPTSLTQYKSNGVTGISVGGTTTESTVIMKGGVSDPSGKTAKLEVEVKPVGTAFTGIPTSSSALVASRSIASVTVTGLAKGQYHWQARATNSNGLAGSWQSAGGNAESVPDFIVSTVPVTLTVSPSSGQQGTKFTFSGTGYTQNGAITYHVRKLVLLQKIWLFYKTSEKHHKWDIYMP